MKFLQKKYLLVLTTFTLLLTSFTSLACSPCGALQGVTQNLVGTNLELTFTSNAGWECCYTVQIELICANEAFTGVPNFFSEEICFNGGLAASTTVAFTMVYPLTVLDLSGLCPGDYKWRAEEGGICGIYTPEFTFTLGTPNPMIINGTQSADTICEFDNVQLNASAINGCTGGPYSFDWSPAAGLNFTNIADPIASPSVTTTYTLTVSEPGECTTPQTMDFTIVVNPTPEATITGTVSICDGDPPVNITITGLNGTAPYTIDYTLNSVPQTPIVTSGSEIIVAPNSPPGFYTYELTNIQDASITGCSQVLNTSVVVTVNALPVVDAGLDLEVCDPYGGPPATVTLAGAGASTYTWDFGAIDGVPIVPPAGTTTTYTVTGTDINGCIGTDQIDVTVNVIPDVTITGTTSLCENDPATNIVITVQGGVAPYNVDYTLDGVPQTTIISTGSTTITGPNSPPGTYVYTVTHVDESSANGCEQNLNETATITVNALPNVSAGGDIEICDADPGNPTLVTLNGSGASTYTWTNGVIDGVPFSPPLSSTTVYTVTGTDANGCVGTDIVQVSSFTLPIASFTADPIFGNAPLLVDFTNTSVYATTYAWDFGDLNTANTSSPINVQNTYLQAGFYTVTLTASNGICVDIFTSEIEVIPPMIVIPPNIFTPNGDESNDLYFVNVDYGANFEATILNRWGNVMYTLHAIDEGWDGKTLNGNEAEEGVYFVKYTATDFNGNHVEGHTYFTLAR
ncbi:MAG: gliding motility-associated-like protein [Crocinitomicaceae bacterium]|jgi:gliding motility-associated-like protein